jgi:uncharacterized membrane protein YbjE (DUF340 family)
MDCGFGAECDSDIIIAKEIGWFTYRGVKICKLDPCFGAVAYLL